MNLTPLSELRHRKAHLVNGIDQSQDRIKAFTDAVESALDAASIYPLTSHGWESEEYPDPENLGHAMWQVDGPQLPWGDSSSRTPGKEELHVITLMEDFHGLMNGSRLSIGMALVWRGRSRTQPFSEADWFWLHHLDASTKLAMATERLRDLLIRVVTREDPDVFRSQGSAQKKLATPFAMADSLVRANALHDTRMDESLGALPRLGVRLWKHVSSRNALVHEVATHMARFTQAYGEGLRRTPLVTSSQEERIDHQELIKRSSERVAELSNERDSAAVGISDWYQALISSSNHVFQVEHWARRIRDYR